MKYGITAAEEYAVKELLFWVREVLLVLAVGLLLIVGMLAFALLIRPLMIVAFIAMIGVFILSLFRPSVRAWLQTPVRS